MRPIPPQLKEKLAKDKFYENCCVCYTKGVQWHHNLIFDSKQVNQEFCILPLCPPCHEKANEREFRETLNWIMWNRASEEQISYYSKAINYAREKERLNKKYGKAWKLL